MIGLRPREEEVRLVLVFGLGSPGILDAECGKHCFEVILERLTSASLSPVLNTKRETQKPVRSEEHTSELQSLMRISYAVFCLKKKKQTTHTTSQKKAHY